MARRCRAARREATISVDTERRIALALKKQRLLMQIAAQRNDFARYAQPLEPLFGAADRVRAGLLWLKRHPGIPVAVVTALAVARPRALFRWARRGWFAWQMISRLRAAPNAAAGLPVAALARRWFGR